MSVLRDDDYYPRASSTSTLRDVMIDVRKRQGDEFPVFVRFGYIDDLGRRRVESGLVTGVLDNGDEVFIDAGTLKYREATEALIAQRAAEQEKQQ